MADVKLEDIKILRERLGTGMIDTKNALVEAEGDIEKAIEILRLKGLKQVSKREDRSTSEGLVAAKTVDGATTIIELGTETDFVAKNEKFIALSEKVLEAVSAAGASTLEEALAAPGGRGTVADVITDEAAILGEKIELRRVARVEGSEFAVYLHKTSKDLPPQVGVVVAYTGSDADTARGIAQHVAMFDPAFLSRDEVPADAVENERRIVTEIATAEGKPEAALPKIIEGRLTGFFKERVLLDQGYAKDSKVAVSKILDEAGLAVQSFVRFKVGA